MNPGCYSNRTKQRLALNNGYNRPQVVLDDDDADVHLSSCSYLTTRMINIRNPLCNKFVARYFVITSTSAFYVFLDAQLLELSIKHQDNVMVT